MRLAQTPLRELRKELRLGLVKDPGEMLRLKTVSGVWRAVGWVAVECSPSEVEQYPCVGLAADSVSEHLAISCAIPEMAFPWLWGKSRTSLATAA